MATSSPEEVATLLIGAGPAGVSAAVWLDDFSVPFDWVDARGSVGGMLRRVHNRIVDYPGAIYENGGDLHSALADYTEANELTPRAAVISRLELGGAEVTAVDDDERHQTYRRVVLATGTTYRRLDIPGEMEGMGRWVSQSATADAQRVAGRPVAVVGGGDAGFEDALRLAEHDCRVTMILRSTDHRARPAFVRAAERSEKISIDPIPSTVKRIVPADEGCLLHIDRNGQEVTREAACLFVRIGVDPAYPAGCRTLETDESGFLVVDGEGRTSDGRVFAAGDVTSTSLRAVATAVGDGAEVARHCADDLGFL